MANELHKIIDEFGAALGMVCVFGSSLSIEVAAAANYDFVLVDGQHGEFDRVRMGEAVRALESTRSVAMARPRGKDFGEIGSLLDIGYSAILVPMVNTAEEARAVVEAAYYPQEGQRSQATCRSAVRGGSEYRKNSNEDLFVMVMIETVEALQNIEAIAALEGISGCFVGTTDLASSMGIMPGQPKPPDFEEAVETIRKATRIENKVAAIACVSAEDADKRIEQRFQMLTVQTEIRLLANAHKKLLDSINR